MQGSIIKKGAQLGSNVVIEPFSIIGENVVLHDNVHIKSHVVIDGRTTIGERTIVYPFSTIGLASQDLKYKGEDSAVVIGKNNVIREHVTIHKGTALDQNKTVIGDECLFMVGCHVAHDCIVGSHVVLANNVTLAGHVQIDDFVIVGGLSAVHQRVRIGKHAIIGGMSGVESNVVPYGLVKGDRAFLHGINLVGLKRHGFSNKDIKSISAAFDALFFNEEHADFSDGVESVRASFQDDPHIIELIDFIESTNRPLCLKRRS